MTLVFTQILGSDAGRPAECSHTWMTFDAQQSTVPTCCVLWSPTSLLKYFSRMRCGMSKKSLSLFFLAILLLILSALYKMDKLTTAPSRGLRKVNGNPEESRVNLKAGSNSDVKRCSRWVVADFQQKEPLPKVTWEVRMAPSWLDRFDLRVTRSGAC